MNLCFLKSPLGQVSASRKETNIPSGTQLWGYCNRIMTKSYICNRPWQPGHASGFMRVSGKEVRAALLCFNLYRSAHRRPGQPGGRADPRPFYPTVVSSGCFLISAQSLAVIKVGTALAASSAVRIQEGSLEIQLSPAPQAQLRFHA